MTFLGPLECGQSSFAGNQPELACVFGVCNICLGLPPSCARSSLHTRGSSRTQTSRRQQDFPATQRRHIVSSTCITAVSPQAAARLVSAGPLTPLPAIPRQKQVGNAQAPTILKMPV